MKRKTPLKRTKPLTRKTPVKKIREKKISENEQYLVIRAEKLAEHPECHFKLTGCTTIATDIHHAKGRGIYFLEKLYMKPCCRNCHEIIGLKPVLAKFLGAVISKMEKEKSPDMQYKYILEDKIPVPCDDVIQWAEFFESADRQVAFTMIDGDKIVVSTVFLGLDNSLGILKPPLLFETMIFGGEFDLTGVKTATWEAAEKQHELFVIKAATPPPESN